MYRGFLFTLAILCTTHWQLAEGEVVQQDICTECEQTVGTIHLVLSNNETETEVLAAMTQVCKFLPQEYGALVSKFDTVCCLSFISLTL